MGKRIGLIVPAYNESKSLLHFHEATSRVLETLNQYDWEIHIVDDGSRDDTWSVIRHLSAIDPKVHGLRLSRNFGKEIALTAGAESVRNLDAVIFIDADLQHPPDLIPELLRQWEEGFQIVSTKRMEIRYSRYRELGSRFFYWLLNNYSDLRIEPKSTDYRLLDRAVLDVLCTFEERTRFFRGLIDWMGFRKTIVTFNAADRVGGDSSFKFKQLLNLAINSMTSFSLLPLRFTGYVGVLVTSLAMVALGFMVVTHFFMHWQYYTPLAYFVVFNTMLFGIVLAALGLIALYIGHIHNEVIRRPLYIIQERSGLPIDRDQDSRHV